MAVAWRVNAAIVLLFFLAPDQKNMVDCFGCLIVVWLFIWCCSTQRDISFHPTTRYPWGFDRANPSTSCVIDRQPNWSRRMTYDLPPASQSTPINSHINQLRNNTIINRARERGCWRPAMDDVSVQICPERSGCRWNARSRYILGGIRLEQWYGVRRVPRRYFGLVWLVRVWVERCCCWCNALCCSGGGSVGVIYLIGTGGMFFFDVMKDNQCNNNTKKSIHITLKDILNELKQVI